uniref:Uncharacterized protein n=1 Tax=Arundo donax TaxID=35708 RepID=A0A0A9BI25_ARUDO
MELTESSAS